MSMMQKLLWILLTLEASLLTEQCIYEPGDKLYSEEQPSVSLGCNRTHFTMYVEQWPIGIQPVLFEVFIQCDRAACVSAFGAYHNQKMNQLNFHLIEEVAAELRDSVNCTLFGTIYDNYDFGYYRLPNASCSRLLQEGGDAATTTDTVPPSTVFTTATPPPSTPTTIPPSTVTTTPPSIVTTIPSSTTSPGTPPATTPHSTATMDVTTTMQGTTAAVPELTQTDIEDLEGNTSTSAFTGGTTPMSFDEPNVIETRWTVLGPVLVISLCLLLFACTLLILLTNLTLKRRRKIRKHYDIGGDEFHVDLGPVAELKYDISLARCHQLNGSSQSIFLKLYREDDCMKPPEPPKSPDSVCPKKPGCDISLYSMDSTTDAKNVTGSTVTTNISAANEEVMLDSIRTESVWTPYCEFSTYNPKSPLTASYTINLNLTGVDSKLDEEESDLGSPNVVMLMENSWKFAESEIAECSSGLSKPCLEPHFLGNPYDSEEEDLGYGNFSVDCQMDDVCMDERAVNEGYRSPIEYGLPVADITCGDQQCGRAPPRGGVKKCSVGGDSGLEDTEMYGECYS